MSTKESGTEVLWRRIRNTKLKILLKLNKPKWSIEQKDIPDNVIPLRKKSQSTDN